MLPFSGSIAKTLSISSLGACKQKNVVPLGFTETMIACPAL